MRKEVSERRIKGGKKVAKRGEKKRKVKRRMEKVKRGGNLTISNLFPCVIV